MALSKNRILGSPKSQNSRFFDFGHFEPDITDFVKNLWREMTPSKIWILGSEHRCTGLGTPIHGQAWASTGWARASTSKFWGIFRFWVFWARYHRFCEEFIKGNATLPKLDFKVWARAQHEQAQAEHEQAQAEHEQSLELSDFGRFEPDITDFVKNLYRKMTPSKN